MFDSMMADDALPRPLYVAEAVHDAGGYPYVSPGPTRSTVHPLDALACCEQRLLELERKATERCASVEPKGAA